MAELPAYDITVAAAGVHMPQLLVRDVPEDIVDALKRRASEHGRSAEAEHHLILGEALLPEHAGLLQRAATLRDETRGHVSVPSEELIRQHREEHEDRPPSNACGWRRMVMSPLS